MSTRQFYSQNSGICRQRQGGPVSVSRSERRKACKISIGFAALLLVAYADSARSDVQRAGLSHPVLIYIHGDGYRP
jgi:hypothetical protein